ncbi:MAG: SIMPL domain-containing protein [Thermoleophilia bacterium]
MQSYTHIKYRKGLWILAATAAVVLATVVLAGCASGDVTPAAAGADGASQPIDTVTVSGQGMVKAGPDEAVLTVMVENDAPDAAQALDANSKQMTKVLDRLKAEGLDESVLQTANVAVYPNRVYNPDTGKETVEGYRAQNSIRVTLTDLSKVGGIFAAATDAGANNVMGPEWRLNDDTAAVAQALDEAFSKARAKAEALATAAGLKLGDLVLMQESGSTMPPVMYEEARAGAAADVSMAVPINPLDLEINASVTLTYRLAK